MAVGEEAIVADAVEALGNDVKEEPADELLGAQRHDLATPLMAVVPPAEAHLTGDRLRVSFVGHSTVLLQTQGLNILTDPIWSERAGPFDGVGPRRRTTPGVNFDDLPKIDLILISHNHYDHLDLDTLKRIHDRDRPRMVVPLGNDTIIHSRDPAIRVDTLDWGESLRISEAVLLPDR